MKLFALVSPASTMLPHPFIGGRFQSINLIGTWKSWRCPGGAEHSTFGPPLVVEWGRDGRDVGDISWAYAGYDFIASAQARGAFTSLGEHFHYAPVIIRYGRLRPGSVMYEKISDKDFAWPAPNKTVSIDAARNNLERIVECNGCGRWKWKFKIHDIIVDRSLIAEMDAFCIAEVGEYSPVFVTEAYRVALEQARLENVAFLEAGSIR